MEAGRGVTDLLTRNFLKAYGVWWFPPLVIQLGAFLVASAWGLVLYTTTRYALRAEPAGRQVRPVEPSSSCYRPCTGVPDRLRLGPRAVGLDPLCPAR